MKKTIIIASFALVSWGAMAQHDHSAHNHAAEKSQTMTPMFKDKALETAFADYVLLKDALIAAQSADAKKAAEKLQLSIAVVKNGKAVQQEVDKLAKVTTIEKQRTAFSALSNEMMLLVKNESLATGEIYVAFCPMANGNKGGYWLSKEKEIRNPYFGDMMMNCGVVKETIK